MESRDSRIGKGLGVIAAVMLLAVLVGFAARFGVHAAERILAP